MFVIKQLLSLNSKAVMELDHQRTLMEALHASKQPISTEFVTLLCALLAQYRRHKINEPYIALYKPLLIEMLFSASRNFTPRSLIQTLNILNPFTDTNHIQQWDVVVHSTFEEDIELSRLEVQTIHRLLHFCEKQQLDLKSRDRLLRLVERSLSTVIKDLPKPVRTLAHTIGPTQYRAFLQLQARPLQRRGAGTIHLASAGLVRTVYVLRGGYHQPFHEPIRCA
jgi:hypothetical protein